MKLTGIAAIIHAERTGKKLTSAKDGKTQLTVDEAQQSLDESEDLTSVYVEASEDELNDEDRADIDAEQAVESMGISANKFATQKAVGQ